MTAKKFMEIIKKANENAKVALGCASGSCLTHYTVSEDGGIQLMFAGPADPKKPIPVKDLAGQLECLPKIDMALYSTRVYAGTKEVLFVCISGRDKEHVWLETEDDVDMGAEIGARFQDAIENGEDELDVYAEMVEVGVTPEMVGKYCGAAEAAHMKEFCETHGLL